MIGQKVKIAHRLHISFQMQSCKYYFFWLFRGINHECPNWLQVRGGECCLENCGSKRLLIQSISTSWKLLWLGTNPFVCVCVLFPSLSLKLFTTSFGFKTWTESLGISTHLKFTIRYLYQLLQLYSQTRVLIVL